MAAAMASLVQWYESAMCHFESLEDGIEAVLTTDSLSLNIIYSLLMVTPKYLRD